MWFMNDIGDPKAFMEGFDSFVAYDVANPHSSYDETLKAIDATGDAAWEYAPRYCDGAIAAMDALIALTKERQNV